jgi:3-hydroxy-D-aspartate aldolase
MQTLNPAPDAGSGERPARADHREAPAVGRPESAPAVIGMSILEVDTPALLIDLDALERNLERMANAARSAGVALRPHAKTHKCPEIARMQIAAGAVGVCCQKVSEAQVMAAGGVRDILISNEIVGGRKLDRLARLAAVAQISVCADNPANVDELSAAARAHGVSLRVLIEIDVGAKRCGVASAEAAVALARRIATSRGLSFGGIHAYRGPAQHLREYEGRQQAIAEAISHTRAIRHRLSAEGLECATITGGGTGTFGFEATSGVYTEIQPGSYVFMDADYRRNRAADGGAFEDFEQSLFVLATVMSNGFDNAAVVDAGMKALSVDSGMPLVAGIPSARYVRASDEHGTLELSGSLHLGDHVRLIPGHCDPTVNLHDWYVGLRGDRVEAVWPVAARGPGF